MTPPAVVGELDDVDALRDTVRAADAVVPVGARTQWEVGNPTTGGVEVRAPAGVMAYDPAELTVTAGAGTTVAELAGVLGDAEQECPLDARAAQATVGGVLAAGLSGHRRLRYGPLRDRVLEVRFVTADGRLVKGGGPTVKNVTGFDVPRLLVGSLGTIGVLVRVTLRCQPLAASARWFTSDADPFAARQRMFRPSCVAWDGTTTRVLLEGHPDDVAAEATSAGLDPDTGPDAAGGGPPWPEGSHRGRISVRPSRLRDLAPALGGIAGLGWLAEVGVGTVHVAAAEPAGLIAARDVAAANGGWLLREAGAPGVDGYGVPLPNLAIVERIRAAFDPTGKLSPGRLPGAATTTPAPR
ncbi:MAG TPA: FAD-binding protein [Acidimicrobiia bacterium]|nr:FAD-binding protein [Acidimicrobiia bacterium]